MDTAAATHGNPECRGFTIDLNRAVRLNIPRDGRTLTPQSFETPDGRAGWTVRFPGGRPIATPAFADGTVFMGGGYGSHEFYAFDARSGELVWQLRTSDDGPTAAVVEDGLVAFNTESCTVIVCDAKTGGVVWQEWLGDPLMSQPALWAGKLFIAYPATRPRPKSAEPLGSPGKPRRSNGHRFLCADLRTGLHLWEREISGDVMTAPVVSDGRVYFTCLDGNSFCLEADSGEVVWTKTDQGTCAPLVIEGRVIMTEKGWRGNRLHEGIRRKASRSGINLDEDALVSSESPYLGVDCGGGSGLSGPACFTLDSAVGFSTSPASANLGAANIHIGVSSVSGAWAYQGSRPAYANRKIYNAQGPHLHCVADETGQRYWDAQVAGGGVGAGDQIFLPPSLGREYLYLCSMLGHVVSLHQETGDVALMYATHRRMSFQPCLADGSIYAGTSHGEVICINTGDDDADGWHMWGGNAQHNKSG